MTLTSPPPARTEPAPPPVRDGRLAALFAPTAGVRHLEWSEGLWGVHRNTTQAQALYVANPTGSAQSFDPAGVFGHTGTPLFLAGDVTTAPAPGGGVVCRLAPGSDVWLALTHTVKETT